MEVEHMATIQVSKDAHATAALLARLRSAGGKRVTIGSLIENALIASMTDSERQVIAGILMAADWHDAHIDERP